MWEPGPFPQPALKRVQNLDGNSACMDCGKPETSWGGPTYGILLCVTCAGRHRSLGTHLSVIKSLTMDHWDAAQVKRMELGGNEQLRAWFAKCKTENSALEMKYRTKASTLYRANLQAAAEEEVARLEAGGEERTRTGEGRRAARKGRVFAASEAAAARDLAREAAVAALAKNKKDSTSRRRRGADGGSRAGNPLSTSAAAAAAPVAVPDATDGGEAARRCGNEEYEVVFGVGSLGFTLMKDAVSRALVTRLAPGGAAFRLGVRTGDYLVGVDGNRLYDYDKLMLLLPQAPRPLRLLFEGAGASLAASPPSSLASGQSPPFSTLPSSSHKKKEQQQERRLGPRGIAADRVSSTGSDSDSSSSGSGSTGSSTTTSSGDTSGSETDATNANESAAGDSDAARNGKARRTEEPLPPALEVPERKSPASSAPETTASVSPAAVTAAPSAVARSSGVVRKTAAPTGSREKPQKHGDSAALPRAGTNGDGLGDGKRETAPGVLKSKDRTNGELTAGSKHLGHPAVDSGVRRGKGARAGAVAPASRAITKGERGEGLRETEEAAKDGKSKDVAASAETKPGIIEGAAVRVVGGGKPVKVEAKEDEAVRRKAAPSGSGVRSGEGARAEAFAPASRAMKGERDDGPREEEETKDGKSKDVAASAETKKERIEGAAVRVVEGVKPVKVEAKEDNAVLREAAPRRSDEKETAASLSSSTSSRTAKKAERRARTEKEVGEHRIPAGKGHANGGGEAHAGRGTTQNEEGDGKNEKEEDVAEKREAIAMASSSGRSSPAAVAYQDDSSLFTQGAKVLVRDRKGSAKPRKGLLRRRHGDGTWTVRYSGGLEERRVPEARMRLRAAEEPAVEDAVADSAPVKAPEEGKGHRLRRSRKDRKEGVEEKERRYRGEVVVNGSGSRNRGSAPAGAAKASASAKTGARTAGAKGRSRGWVQVDGTEERHEDFRAPGELRDDFFASDHDAAAAVESSGSDDSEAAVPGLYAYGRVEPPATAASWNPSAYSVAGTPAAYSAPYAAPRRMEGFGGGAMPVRNIPVQQQQPQQQPWGRMVSFPEGSMGLTLTKELGGGCSVTNVVPGGTAQSKGVVVGQRVCAVNEQPTGTYEQTMAIIAGSPRPVSITFLDPVGLTRRGIMPGAGGGPPVQQQQSWADVGITATIGAMDAANAVAVEWGLGAPTTGVLDEVQGPGGIPIPPQGFRVHQKHSLMAIPTGVAGGFGKSLAAHRTFTVDVSPEAGSMTTKKALADQPKVVSGEYDVTFGEGELGMRLEERGSFKASSVVIRVSKDGQATELGVREGCTVVGINGEEYLSHAHTVATLKHAKRPVTVRFRAPESRR